MGQSVALSIAVVVLATACFIFSCVAVALPQWGHFRNRIMQEDGRFGPWTICKNIPYGRELCGPRIVMFRPTFVVFAAGVCGAVGVTALGIYGLTSLLYLSWKPPPPTTTTTSSRRRDYRIYILISKLIISLVAALTTTTAVILFASQGDDLQNGYIITWGLSFYLEVVVLVFTWVLVLFTVGEFISGRRKLESSRDVVDAGARRIVLPSHSNGTNGISMTSASGVPYVSSNVPSSRFQNRHRPPPSVHYNRNGRDRPFSRDNDSWNGSVNSETISPPGSTLNGSTVSTISTTISLTPRGTPLRSSLKKPRATPDSSIIGIPNPGFSGSSPTLSRTSSVKKVRITTFQTDL